MPLHPCRIRVSQGDGAGDLGLGFRQRVAGHGKRLVKLFCRWKQQDPNRDRRQFQRAVVAGLACESVKFDVVANDRVVAFDHRVKGGDKGPMPTPNSANFAKAPGVGKPGVCLS